MGCANHGRMVLQFELEALKSLEQVERFLAGSTEAEVAFPDRKALYGHIEQTLLRRCLGRPCAISGSAAGSCSRTGAMSGWRGSPTAPVQPAAHAAVPVPAQCLGTHRAVGRLASNSSSVSHRSLPLQPSPLLGPLLPGAGPPTLAFRLDLLALTGQPLAYRDGSRVTRDVPRQQVLQRPLPQP